MIRKILAAATLVAVGVCAAVQLRAQSPAQETKASPTFNKDVAPILYKNCTGCHRAGEIGPMPLVSYQDARPWAKAIATQVGAGTMPPWHADSAYGSPEGADLRGRLADQAGRGFCSE
jgi:hypothetical protein